MQGRADKRDIFDELEPLVEAGIAAVWLHPGEKRPVGAKWSIQDVPSYEDLQDSYAKGYNVGVRLGEWSNIGDYFLHIIDMDVRDDDLADEAKAKLLELFPNVMSYPCVKSGSGGASRHFWVLCEKPFSSKKLVNSGDKYKDADGKEHFTWELELLGTGKQAVLPPSIHPVTGKPYKWVRRPDFEAIDMGLGPIVSIEHMEEVTDAYDDDGEEISYAVDALGITLKEARGYLETLLQTETSREEWCDDRDGWYRVGMALHHEFEKSQEAFKLWCWFSKQTAREGVFDLDDNKFTWKRFDAEHKKPVRMATIIDAARMVELELAMEKFEDLGDLDDNDDADMPKRKRERDVDTDDVSYERKKEKKKKKPGPEEDEDEEIGGEDWPEMGLLKYTPNSAPKLPLEVFGQFWAKQLDLWAQNAGAPVDFCAGSLLACAGTAIGNSRWVQARQDWAEPPVMWIEVIGRPSSNKSPGMDPAMKCLKEVEAELNVGLADEKHNWEDKKRVAEAIRKQWDAMVREAIKEGNEAPRMPKEAKIPPAPTLKRLRTTSATIERLVGLVAENPRGIMMFADELSDWYQSLNRYSRASDRPQWIQAYGGREYTMDRVKNEGVPVTAERFSVSLLGGIQPERLAEILMTADDGLAARFIPIWPEPQKVKWHTGLKSDMGAALSFSTLTRLRTDPETGGPVMIPLSKEAQEVFGAWKDGRVREDGQAFGMVESAFGKSDGHVIRIALILEHLWFAEPFSTAPEPRQVSAKAIRAAIHFRDSYIKPMQLRTFGLYNRSKIEMNAVHMATWIARDEVEGFTVREVIRGYRVPGVQNASQVKEIVTYLMELGWITGVKRTKSTEKGGRTSEKFLVNKNLVEAMNAHGIKI